MRLSVHADFKKTTKPLMRKAVNYVLQYKNNSERSSTCFPDWITTANKKSESARLAWCYGDLGIAISLWKAGKVAVNKEWCKKALTVLKHSTKRKDVEDARIKDAGLCHGAYGVMHIYNYMYKETKVNVFKEATQYWLVKAIELAIHKEEYAGYRQWYGGLNSGWRKEVNLLEGIAGIRLAIISFLVPFETKWDECLMIGWHYLINCVSFKISGK